VKTAAEEACLSQRTLERAAAALRLRLIAPTGAGSTWRKDYQWELSNDGGLAEQSQIVTVQGETAPPR
jgi:hypothetical protein